MDDEEQYWDWFNDNRIELMSEFIENHLSSVAYDEWQKYLKDEYKRWKTDR
jgi:hypothetical protein